MNRNVFSLAFLPGLLSLTMGVLAQNPVSPLTPIAPLAPVAPELPFDVQAFSMPVPPLPTFNRMPVAPLLPLPPLLSADALSMFASMEPMMIWQSASPHPNPQPVSPTRDPDYTLGLKAMDEGRWNDAVSAFERSAKATPDRAQAALYWKAYSLEKLGRKDDATATCNQVVADPAKSEWKMECQRLSAETDVSQRDLERMIEREDRDAARDAARDAVRIRVSDIKVDHDFKKEPIDPNDELKIIALNSIMQQDPQKALPVLHSVIFSDKPLELRRRALFILVHSKDPAAQAMLLEAAKDNADVDLERSAVQSLGMKGKSSAPQLKEIYQNATDKRVKEGAVEGLFIAGDATDMVDLARAEKDINLKRTLVSQLSVMKDPAATAYMEELLK